MVKKIYFIFSVILVGFLFVASGLAKKEPKASQETELEKTLPPLQRVMLSKFEGEKGGFGNILIANFTIKNNNEIDVKDIVMECECYAKSGTLLGRTRKTIYEIFPAKKSKRIKRFNMGFMHSQTEKVSCDIVSIIPVM